MMHSSGVQRELMIVKASLSVFDANFVLIYLDDAKLEHWSTVLSASRYQNDPAFAAFLSADRVGQWHGLADLLPKAVSKLNEFSGMEEQYLFDRKVYSSAGKLVGVIRLGIDIRGLLKDAQAASGSLLFYAQGQSVFPTEMAEPDAGLFQSGQYRGGGKLWQRCEDMLRRDIPVIFSVGANFPKIWGRERLRLYTKLPDGTFRPSGSVRAHFMTATALDDTHIRVSSWGRMYYISRGEFDEYVKKHSGSIICNIVYIK